MVFYIAVIFRFVMRIGKHTCLTCTRSFIDAVDFGFGDAQYKQSFNDVSCTGASVYIFAPRSYPVFINILRISVTGLTLALRYIFQKFGSVGWIKHRWCNLLQKNNKD